MFVGIYIAAKFSMREEARQLAERLVGFVCTSRWIYQDAKPEEGAMRDLEDIEAADVFLLMPEPSIPKDSHALAKATSAGRHVEFGYALARGKCIIILGEETNVFQHLVGKRNVAKILHDADEGGGIRRRDCGIGDAKVWDSGSIRKLLSMVRMARGQEGERIIASGSTGFSA